MFTAKIRVVGVTFKNDEDGTPRQDLLTRLYDDWWTEGLADSIEVEARHEPDNPVDPNAVGVWVKRPAEASGRVGFIPADKAEWVSEAIRDGRILSVFLEGMGVARNGAVGLTVALSVREDDDSPDAIPAKDTVTDAEGRTYEFD